MVSHTKRTLFSRTELEMTRLGRMNSTSSPSLKKLGPRISLSTGCVDRELSATFCGNMVLFISSIASNLSWNYNKAFISFAWFGNAQLKLVYGQWHTLVFLALVCNKISLLLTDRFYHFLFLHPMSCNVYRRSCA